MSKPEVSIVIPTYNRKDNLLETVNSILSQDYTDFELIIVDNGPSTDGTGDTVLNISDDRINYLQTSLQGVSYARSIGNLASNGNIIIQMDDDVTLFDKKTLNKVVELFDRYDIDILGAIELKSKEDIIKFNALELNVFPEIKKNILKNIGNIDWLYNISTAFETLIDYPIAIYPIDSFRSCFMCYKKNILNEIRNFDVNYSIIGSKISIREETDFLIRAKNEGKKIYYTNFVAIHHREGIRPDKISVRSSGIKNIYCASSAHSYMCIKDLLSKKQFFMLLYWFIYQAFVGGIKNQGLLRVIKTRKSLVLGFFNLAGFFGGVCFALFNKRRFLSGYKKYINNC